MLNPRVCSVMELLPLVCLWILTWSGGISADPNGPLITKITVKEDDQVVLPCSFGSLSIIDKLFDWKKDGDKEVFMYDRGQHYNNGLPGQDETFRGRVTHFPDKLQSGNASIVIKKSKVADSGNYTCDFPREQPTRRSEIELIVDCILKDRTEENIPGTCQTPFIRPVKSNDGVHLECKVVDASPKPEVEVRDSTGTRVPAKEEKVSQNGNDYMVVLTAVVTKEDYYHCVVEQSEICHQVKTPEIYVPLPGSNPGLYVAVGVLAAVLVGVIITVVLLVKIGLLTPSYNRGSRTEKSLSSEKNKEQNETTPLDIQEKEST